ncbi:FAD-binding domain-containing protein [Stipitochalara longipes BDJ]|nr:FAD-binding domain-containing protein [Stipitochalara longipes BDJ]
MYLWITTTLCFFLHLSLVKAGQSSPSCKAAPGTADWPSLSQWNAFNHSISGQLLQPAPPGAVCYPDQPTYDPALCFLVTNVTTGLFFNVDWYSTLPSASASPLWNNDSCLPFEPFNSSACSYEGYPIYVVNATGKDDVKKGIDFARENNVRLVVKASGHDYLGRHALDRTPNAMTIWVHNIKGISVSNGFRPAGCDFSIDVPAITIAAGEDMAAINSVANQHNLSIISGGEASITYGGYSTGGGHGALGPTYGMAADNVLEMEVVSPTGDILTINECQNRDLFWAMRGGGGSTFGVITSTTIQAFPATPFLDLFVIFGTVPNSEPMWDAVSYWLSQYPILAELGIAGYGSIIPNISIDGGDYGGWNGNFILPVLSPENTSESLAAAVLPIVEKIKETWPGLFLSQNISTSFPTFYDWWFAGQGPQTAGTELMGGSRLLDAETLTANLTALGVAMQGMTTNAVNTYLISGKGVWNAKPRGGSNAVNPAWRKAIIHCTNAVYWPLGDKAEQARQEYLQTNVHVEALRVLAPNSGAYVNEADANEPNFQQTFWGDNYPRLLEIKRRFDPDDVFWCTPCVGNERWKEVGDLLCRV